MTYRQVILTSYLFPDAKFSMERLQAVIDSLGGDTSKLVIDLSCRRRGDKWIVAMNRWQTLTNMEVNQGNPSSLLPPQIKTNLPKTKLA